MEEKLADLMCMLNDIAYMDDLPKYDQYDDDYIKVDSSKQSEICCWEKEEDQLQIKYGNHPVHVNYDNIEGSA